MPLYMLEATSEEVEAFVRAESAEGLTVSRWVAAEFCEYVGTQRQNELAKWSARAKS